VGKAAERGVPTRMVPNRCAAWARRFRAFALRLRQLDRHDYLDHEFDWLDNMIRNRYVGYVYSEREQAFLLRLASYAEVFSSYEGRSVANLIKECHVRLYRLHEDDPRVEWIRDLHNCGASSLLKRQLNRLIDICKLLRVL
jgi:hypothetical protein